MITGLACLTLALVACGGGGGGGSNSGQAPDPVVVDLPIAYVQRPLPVDAAGKPVYPDVFDPEAFNPGGELYIKARATAQAEVVNITRAEFDNNLATYPDYTPASPNYDVKDVSVSPDGRNIVFAMHAPDLDPEDDEGPTWNIWKYELESKKLTRIIASELEAEKGDDVSPHYLPDGRILFSSNRQKRSKEILLDEGKPQFGATTQQDGDITSFLLHSVKDDGTDIQQLTYNQSHDIQPTVMPDGRLLFMRWQGTNPDRLSFYTSNPDGTDIQRYFGYDSLNAEPGEDMEEAPRLFNPQVMPDGRIAAIYMQNTLQLGGDMKVVDGSTAAEGEIKSLSIKQVDIATDIVSLSGRFASLSPLYDGTNRLLVSWSQCRLQEEAPPKKLHPCSSNLLLEGEPIEGYEEAPPFYGIWIYDIASQTQQPVVLAEAGKLFSEAVALGQIPSCSPKDCAAGNYESPVTENVGLLHIRSVYDFDGTFDNLGAGVNSLDEMVNLPIEQRPARFVRITKAVSEIGNDALNNLDLPNNVHYISIFGQNAGTMEILGYAPIEPDGSIKVRVPADVAFSLEILDANGRRISAEHTTKLQLRPGEIMECNGCHDPDSPNPHGRRDLEAAPITSPNLNAVIATLSVDVDELSSYDNLPYPTTDDIVAPATSACRDRWDPLCRIVINYEYHIQPLWELERQSMTVNDPELAMNKKANTCVACHAPADVDGNLQVPLAQLNLQRTKLNTNGDADPREQMTSYKQLLNGMQRQIQYIYDDELADALPVCEFEDIYDFIPQCEVLLDDEGVPTCEGIADCPFKFANEETGELQLDAMGNPVPRMENTGFLLPPMNRGGANANNGFFDKFGNNASHAGFLHPAELKLLSEWLDTNGRYYTNPFELAIPN